MSFKNWQKGDENENENEKKHEIVFPDFSILQKYFQVFSILQKWIFMIVCEILIKKQQTLSSLFLACFSSKNVKNDSISIYDKHWVQEYS